jgi:hypothetical protein
METIARIVATAPAEASIPVAMLANAYVLYKVRAIAKLMDQVHPDYEKDMYELADQIEADDFEQFSKHADAKRKELGLRTTAEQQQG